MANKCDGVARLKRLEQRLDRNYSFLGVRFGWDALLGLIPIVGDVIAAGFGLYLILEARRLGARKRTVARMLGNWALDLAFGSIPVVGDAFDVMWKSNTRNVKLLIADLERRAGQLREVNREQIRAAAA